MPELEYEPDPRPQPPTTLLSRSFGNTQDDLDLDGEVLLKPVATNTLQIRTSDDSAYAIVQAGFMQANIVDSATNTAPVAFEVYHNSTGTPIANFGVALDFQADSATVDRQAQCRISTIWSTPTDATRTSEMRFSLAISAVTTEVLRIQQNGLSLFQTQVVGARNTGWTTFTGTSNKNAGGLDTGTATTAQVAQVVKAMLDALITHGLLGT